MQIQLNKHSFLKFHGCRVVVVLWDMRKNWFPCFRSHNNCMSYKFMNILWKWCRFDALWLRVFAEIRTNHTLHGQRYIDRFLRLLLPFCSQIVYSCNRRDTIFLFWPIVKWSWTPDKKESTVTSRMVEWSIQTPFTGGNHYSAEC